MLDPSILVGHGAIASGAGTPPLFSLEAAAPAINDDQDACGEQDQQAAKTLASVLAMQSSLNSVDNLIEAADQVVHAVMHQCSAAEVVLLWRSQAGKGLKVVARSGQEQRNETSEIEDQMMVAAAEEVAVRDSITTWPVTCDIDRHASLSIRQLADERSVETIQAVSLSEDDSVGRGVLMLLDSDSRSVNGFLRVLRTPLTGALVRIADQQPTRVDAAVRSFVAMTRWRRGGLTLIGLVLFTLLMLMPVRYRVSASLELQPVQRRFIAVPFDGPLEQAHVKPGDMVAVGDLLASMDPRELEYEIAGSRAQWERSEQERKSLMVEHDFAGSKLASLDSERLMNQMELLQHQRGWSEIRSPINGVVVSGDPVQSEGMPMSRGESLFEIAPLGEMVAMVGVPEADFSEVRNGMKVSFFVHAFPNRKLDGVVKRIHPKGELRDHENVFLAEVLLSDPDGIYRPGMQGRASIVGDRHPLGWNLFHPAFYAVRQAIGW